MTAPIQRVVHRVIMPIETSSDVMPLYLDVDAWSSLSGDDADLSFRVSGRNAASLVTGRRSIRLAADSSVSLGTYFNAFPAAYWRRWTAVREVTLAIHTVGDGEIAVVRSNARGVMQTVHVAPVSGDSLLELDLSLDYFVDGGWYWFELTSSATSTLELVDAEWRAAVESAVADDASESDRSGLVIAITTMNRESFCLDLLRRIASDGEVTAEIDTIFVMDQGSRLLRDADGFDEVVSALGGRLVVIEQDNIGGAGGFARGMYEAVRSGSAAHVLLLDDDVQVEPEGILRALRFSRSTVTPMIVGGHMFDMYDKSRLHAIAEGIDTELFDWGPIGPTRHDFTNSNLRQTKWLHRRFDSDYNGWWMSLIPVSTIEKVGLALPVFIKWDDAEFSLRATESGVPTVSFPGAALWHVSWVDKDDSHDWQAFYHARNRLIAALLHSPHEKGGRLPRRNFALDVRYLLTADYYTVALRLDAYESVLAGPWALHGELRGRLGELRARAADFVETSVITDVGTAAAGSSGGTPRSSPSRLALLRAAFSLALRHGFTAPKPSENTVAHVSYEDASWWVVGAFDEVLVSNAQGSGATLHRRDRRVFWQMLRRSIVLNLRYRRRWASLASDYRASLPSLTSMSAWATTFGLHD